MIVWLRTIALIGMVIFLKTVKQEIVPAIFILKVLFSFMALSFVLVKTMKKQNFIKLALFLCFLFPIIFYKVGEVIKTKNETPFIDVLNADNLNVFYTNLVVSGVLIASLAYFSFFKKAMFNTFFKERVGIKHTLTIFAVGLIGCSAYFFCYPNEINFVKNTKQTMEILKELNKNNNTNIFFSNNCDDYKVVYKETISFVDFKDLWVDMILLNPAENIDNKVYQRVAVGAINTMVFGKSLINYQREDFDELEKRLKVCVLDAGEREKYKKDLKKVSRILKEQIRFVAENVMENAEYRNKKNYVKEKIKSIKLADNELIKFNKDFSKYSNKNFYKSDDCKIDDILIYYKKNGAKLDLKEKDNLLNIKINSEKIGKINYFVYDLGDYLMVKNIIPNADTKIKMPSPYIRKLLVEKYNNLPLNDLILTTKTKNICHLLRIDYIEKPL